MRTLLASLALLVGSLTAQPAFSEAELYQLSFNNVEQQQVSLGEYKGKVILLNFWATWCPPCVKEMPTMERLRNHFSDQPFEIVAINAGEQSAAVESFLMDMEMKGTPLTFPILLDEKGRSFREFGLKGLPMTFLFDQQGELIETIGGGADWDTPEKIKKIENILGSEKTADI